MSENRRTKPRFLKSLAAGSGLFLLAVAMLVVPVDAQDSAHVYPDEAWEEWPTAEEAGYSAEAFLRRGLPLLIDRMNTTGLVVVVEGRILGQFGDVEELSYIASCRKSVLAMLYGNYVSNGTIQMDATLEELGIDDVGGLLPIEKRATVKDLISSRSGVYHPASYPGDDLERAPARGSKQPGEFYLYSNWDFNAAGAIFEQVTGIDIYDAVEKDLAIPLQMQDFDRSVQKKEGDLELSRYEAYPMWFSTRDMARLGYLMLRNGRWKDQQVIPAEWVRQITSVVTPPDEMNFDRDGMMAFGYMWWVWADRISSDAFAGAYTARGALGQFITVLPELDMVVAHKTKEVYGRTTEWRDYLELLEIIVASRTASR